jgi:hypothetical protein
VSAWQSYRFSRRAVARHKCRDCGINTVKAGDYCLLTDEIWRDTLGLGWDDNLCIACIELRLGRKLSLRRQDFSFPFVEGFPPSATLLDRYGASKNKPRKKKPRRTIKTKDLGR